MKLTAKKGFPPFRWRSKPKCKFEMCLRCLCTYFIFQNQWNVSMCRFVSQVCGPLFLSFWLLILIFYCCRDASYWKIEYECVRCLRAIMNNTIGIKQVFSQREPLMVLARSVDTNKPKLMLEAVQVSRKWWKLTQGISTREVKLSKYSI